MRGTRLRNEAAGARRPRRTACARGQMDRGADRGAEESGKIGRSARVAKVRRLGKSNASTRAPTAGRGLLVALALFFLTGLCLWLWLGGGSPRANRAVPSRSEAEVAPARAASSPLREPAREAEEAPPAPGDELEPFVGARSDPADFVGPHVSLRGRVEISGEEPFPQIWKLSLRPARFLPGRETAVTRTLEFAAGQREFELLDVPLGGYELVAEAQGFNGLPLPVLLEKGSTSPFLVVHMVPAGLLEGRVLDANGLPAEGVPITLFQQIGGTPRESVTDAAGVFRFGQLPDGAYDLLVGKESSPLLRERRPVRFAAPHLTFPDIELPLLGELHVRVVDSLARPLEGVEVRGSGTNGGLVEGKTDYDGRLIARHLPAGHFRLRLEHPGFDPSFARRVTVEVTAGAVAEAPLRLGP